MRSSVGPLRCSNVAYLAVFVQRPFDSVLFTTTPGQTSPLQHDVGVKEKELTSIQTQCAGTTFVFGVFASSPGRETRKLC